MILKTRAPIYVGVGVIIGLVIGILTGHFLMIPQQVAMSGVVSSNSMHPALFVLFRKANSGSECKPIPYSPACDHVANVTGGSTYSITIMNNQPYEIFVGYDALNSSSSLISVLTARWCSAGNLMVDSISLSISYNITCVVTTVL